MINYKVKSSIISILKDKIDKKKFEKKITTKIQIKNKTQWIIIIIHNTMVIEWIVVSLLSLIFFNFCYFIKFNNITFL